MGTVEPKYLIALGVVVALAALIVLGNPDKKYSRKAFWEDASVASVAEVPESALAPGNKNGPVLMWAAMSVDDPRILHALVARGVDVNEHDGIFMGTPLTGVASEGRHPEILSALVDLGADIDVRVHGKQTALMVAAQYNRAPGMATRLLELGLDPDARDASDKTALDYALQKNNQTVIDEIRGFKRSR
ncbi:MAG: ankyrin repeat domain-containing protein [Wenzhouxiangellaceae bacterium]|nr:ankyrin repeat domain-containing protein [Wenzhouxiangellaceae bacterium]